MTLYVVDGSSKDTFFSFVIIRHFSFTGKAGSITVIGNGPVPFAALGEEIGKYVQVKTSLQ